MANLGFRPYTLGMKESLANNPSDAETILVVEDDARSRKVVTSMLEATGYRVVAAADAIEALSAFADTSLKIDIVLSDVKIPGMTGPDLVACLRSRRPGLWVLLMSGATEGLTYNAPILQKPFGMDDLHSGLAKTLSRLPAAS